MDNEQLLKIILERFDKIDRQFEEINQHFQEVHKKLDKVETFQQEDLRGTLYLISKKVDGLMYDIEFLSAKSGKHDTILNRLEKKIKC